jgi:hypothetical protein
MSADSAWAVQAAVYSRLAATAPLTSLLTGGVRDHVPPGTPFPYLVLAEMRLRSLDTQQGGGHDITLALRSYSRGEGMKELRSIMAAVFDALHNASFTVSGQTLVLCQEIEAETRLEPDGLTRSGLQRFRIVTEPV